LAVEKGPNAATVIFSAIAQRKINKLQRAFCPAVRPKSFFNPQAIFSKAVPRGF
jgi:hypothetical protein